MAEMTRKELVLALIGAGAHPRLGGLDLSDLDMAGLTLNGADLSKANLGGANLGGAGLYQANLLQADLRRTNLNGAIVSKEQLRMAIANGSPPPASN